ncbi:SAM-dependent methyltransferase [Agromyces protaetiae]|uniref:SAM-dependent methyltransferase n=1 Tax=Agromyces protaetiae TaxID=2509455 RepID=A0A4P6FAX2_9MICO|nr:fused MFS/spermidine synthase [Agromyces protaetiae]QAY73122.1 SAM-dependent methyltransferase [Agromyces protaetiae]
MGSIEFETDGIARGVTLLVDGQAQSHVDPSDPTRLFFEYVRRIGHAIDAAAAPGAPISALHLGGGALTLPRYIAATRPGSVQVVVDHDPALVAAVLDRLPAPPGVEFVVDDAQTVIAAHGAADLVPGPFDLVVLDLYTGLEAPAFVDEPGFLAAALGRLGPTGILVVNVADAAGLARLRALGRALSRAAPSAEVLVAGDPSVLSGAEEGNAVVVAAPHGFPRGLERRLASGGPFPAEILTGARLDFALWGAC